MKLLAPPGIQARHLTLQKQGGLSHMVKSGELKQRLSATPLRVKKKRGSVTIFEPLETREPGLWKSLQRALIDAGPPVNTPVVAQTLNVGQAGSVPLGQPIPERLTKADSDFITSLTPPFTKRIEAPYQRYRNNLGTAGILALDALYSLGAQALGSSFARLTSKYDPNHIDAPGHRDYSHMSETQRQAYLRFEGVWKQIDEDMQRVAFDLVFELTRPGRDGPMTIEQVGRELTNYNDERRAIGGGVAALRLLAARVLVIMRSERRRAA